MGRFLIMAGGMRVKPALRWVHRWLALTLGVIFTIVCLSGSLLLFQDHFFRWAHGDLIPANLSQEVGSLDRWVASARQALPPESYGPIAFWPPHYDHNISDAGMLIYYSGEPRGFLKEGFAGVLVEPATGKLLGTIDIDRSPAYAPLALHGALWSGEVGKVLVAVMAIGVLIMLPLGLYLWWPTRKRLIPKLSPRPWRTTVTHAGRLHDVAGGWAVIVLFVLAGTGLYLARDEWVEPVLTAFVGPEHGGSVPESNSCAGPIGFDEAVRRGHELVPSGRWVAAFPHDEASLRRFELVFKTSESVREEVHVLADMQCGVVTVEETPATRSPRDATELWLATLHDGTAFGLPGQILITLIGMAPLVLLWSGIRMWMRRRGWLETPAKSRPVSLPAAQ